MIGVLTDDDDLHPVERTKVEGVEDERPGGITGVMEILLAHQPREIREIRLLKLGPYLPPP